jgi:predicted SprT family Zn-dependent metalloprotease
MIDVEVQAKFNEVKVLAEKIYGINCGLLKLKTTLVGTSAGLATMAFPKGLPKLEINLNINAINGTDEQRDHVINNTIAHEMAHIVNYLLPSSGNNHNRGWQRVCRNLGGDGNATYSVKKVGNISSSVKYLYEVNGNRVFMGKIRHNRTQRRSTVYYYSGYKIDPSMWTGNVV